MNTSERKYSIVMTCYDQATELESNLPAFLTQEYEPGYEVIVVNESSTDQTEDVLKLFKSNYPHLIPPSCQSQTYRFFARNLPLTSEQKQLRMNGLYSQISTT